MTQQTSQMNVGGLTDAELLSGLQRLVRADRALSVKLLLHLGELDARGVYRERAYGSTHEYCVKVLRMSDAEAYLRINAARLGRRFPRVLELFGQGELHLSAIKLIGPLLTADSHVHVLERARGKSKREIELIVAELAPRPDVPASMRKLPCVRMRGAVSTQTALAPGAEAPVVPCPASTTTAQPSNASIAAAPAPVVPCPASTATTQPSSASIAAAAAPAPVTFALEAPRARASCTPLSPGKFTLKLTLDQAAHDKLEQLRELLRHQLPSGNLASVVERALDVLLEQTLQRRFGQKKAKAAKRPRAVKRTVRSSKVRSRYIPPAVVREVHARDGGQCSFVSAEGKRCEARGFLELHHHVPFARGGASTTENLKLMCTAHNALLAERDYGRDFIRAKKHRMAESDPASLRATSKMPSGSSGTSELS